MKTTYVVRDGEVVEKVVPAAEPIWPLDLGSDLSLARRYCDKLQESIVRVMIRGEWPRQERCG